MFCSKLFKLGQQAEDQVDEKDAHLKPKTELRWDIF